jgi:hypothetical protein
VVAKEENALLSNTNLWHIPKKKISISLL